jgi:hypothetical protein
MKKRKNCPVCMKVYKDPEIGAQVKAAILKRLDVMVGAAIDKGLDSLVIGQRAGWKVSSWL